LFLIAAPGDPLNVHEQNPPTDLTVLLIEPNFPETDEQFVLPDPLNDPIVEQLVKRRTAETL
jgi:aminomethyltransferase